MQIRYRKYTNCPQMKRWTVDLRTDRQIDKRTDRLVEKSTDRHVDRPTNKQEDNDDNYKIIEIDIKKTK